MNRSWTVRRALGPLALATALVACAAFREAAKDPAAAVAQAKTDAAAAEKALDAACTELGRLEGAGLVQAGPARSDADAFCAAVAAARGN